jgi:hypothetical protein
VRRGWDSFHPSLNKGEVSPSQHSPTTQQYLELIPSVLHVPAVYLRPAILAFLARSAIHGMCNLRAVMVLGGSNPTRASTLST